MIPTFPRHERQGTVPQGQSPLPLLTSEPRVADWARQDALTQHHLTPVLPELESLFLHLRSTLDPSLSAAKPFIVGKAYPYGQCLEISEAVKQHLRTLDPSTLPPAPARGFNALAGFLGDGGDMRLVWGDLRGQYFQNAFLAGTLYIDVSNDTVVVTKPKVEILPLQEANYRPIRDHGHFARIAEKYWNARVVPNHVLPLIAPYFPVLATFANGTVVIPHSDYMFGLAKRDAFEDSAHTLATMEMDEALFGRVAAVLKAGGLPVPGSRAEGRAQGIAACAQYRGEGRHLQDADNARLGKVLREVNRLLG